ncbi:MAG: cell envelope integrity protein CreD [Chitinophagaceae bacterium]
MESTLQETVKTAWNKSKWIIKGGIIGAIALLLMIPMLYVKDLIFEREKRQQEAAHEITGKWAGPQNLIGPVIAVPFWRSVEDTAHKIYTTKHIAYFLPDELTIDATINPKEKHRGIYKVMLYDAKVDMKGSFSTPAFEKLHIPADKMIWDEAFIRFSVADNKGLNDQVQLKWNDSTLELSPLADDADGMTAPLKIKAAEELKNIHFSALVDLNGSEQLFFTPLGKSTTVNINSAWKNPSFTGNMLPQKTAINNKGFTASWKSMAHRRNFPQQWVDNAFGLDFSFTRPPTAAETDHAERLYAGSTGKVSSVAESSFGVNLFIPVNGYQKTLRTVKYALLCILLTFTAFFLIETAHKKSVHPFQYGLVGLALILFYTLLLSFSEYTGFNTAYIIAASATIGLIAWFVKSILQSGKATTVLSVALALIYSYIFSLLQLQDYSLLLGSVGLFITLAVVMYFSKKLQW